MKVIRTLLKTVSEKLPRTQAPAKFSQAGCAGSAKALVRATSAIDLIEVKTMKTKGAIQSSATTTSAIHKTTSTGSVRFDPTGRKAAARILIARLLPAASTSGDRG